MVQLKVSLYEHTTRILDLVGTKFKLKDGNEVVNFVVEGYENFKIKWKKKDSYWVCH